ncbi:MAG: hypothetical protein MK179_19370 [Pirellulaceae bacterium]|nr:hypothetical protein [Pirellulaceae bacterium]
MAGFNVHTKILTKPLCTLASVFVAAILLSTPVLAIPPLVDEFKAKYVAAEPATDTEKAFAEAANAAKCNICHVDGEKKSVRNRFGEALAELIDKDKIKAGLQNDADAAKKELSEVFDKIAAMKFAADQENSPTFAQVIALGKLPGSDHDVGELIAAISPTEAAEEPAAEEPAADTATAAISGSVGELIDALMNQIKQDIKGDLAEELSAQLKDAVMQELMAKLPDAIREGLKTERLAAEHAERVAHQDEAIKKIEEIGGTVREIAMNDDRKEVAFHLSGKELTDEGLLQVRYIDKMIMLHLKGTQITDDGLKHLVDLPTLEKLHLEETKLTDNGLDHLRNIPKLKWLNIYGTEVSDAGIEQLKQLKNLEKLYIWQTKITIPGFQQLQASLPNTEIIPDLVKEKQRAEEEAKRKEEEKRKAEEEAKKKAEEEAKKKAEEEAKKKAEEEAKKKAEEEAKKKAEEEAKQKAAEEAKKAAEAEQEKAEDGGEEKPAEEAEEAEKAEDQ